MSEDGSGVLEGVFVPAIHKPSGITSGQCLLHLQNVFSRSTLFAPLLASTRQKRIDQASFLPSNQKNKADDEEANGRFFRMGHGGTLDPLASGILIIGIGRGTRALQNYLGCTKTYETVVLFGKSTDTYDVDGEVVAEKTCAHMNEALVREKLAAVRGKFRQVPPLYSALKIDGVKACDYVRAGKELPRELEAREVCVDECEVLEWWNDAKHDFRWPGESTATAAPAVKVRLTVSSGFYVRSFAYDLGTTCGSLATLDELVRTRQANFAIRDRISAEETLPAVTYADLDAGEDVWGPVVKHQLRTWIAQNPPPAAQTHVNGRDPGTKKRLSEEEKVKTRQRFRGEWVGTSRKERRRQQKAAKACMNGQNDAAS
ncbi:pseudouridine synthase pus4 [Didymosphaeria variabile]|uniref:tRNA pseudouridine(55) synthase n=1 Tax=Didymosphaeria variabile TaxID=1932322 RepID=A0A9W8XPZ9_9PLEO|nr:pseudouridine synthase pus4 [Didymosphaeria variabile]KAJ4356264.1 pseudouridine synthase pus4 [Didymosphaeria variabile]